MEKMVEEIKNSGSDSREVIASGEFVLRYILDEFDYKRVRIISNDGNLVFRDIDYRYMLCVLDLFGIDLDSFAEYIFYSDATLDVYVKNND